LRSRRDCSKASVSTKDRATSQAFSWRSCGIRRNGTFGQHIDLSSQPSQSCFADCLDRLLQQNLPRADMMRQSLHVRYRETNGPTSSAVQGLLFGPTEMRWMAPAHGIWVPKCEGHKAFTSKMGAIRYADYHDRPRLGQERFSGPRC
jgi:hypothetical protein